MKLAAIILNFRTAEMTIEAISSTISALNEADFEWTIVVVDNDSGDGSEEKLRQFCANQQQKNITAWNKVEIIQSGHNGGFGAGNNVGIRKVMLQYDDLDYIYILNSDAFPEKKALQALVDVLDAEPQCGAAGSYIYGEDGEPHITAFRFPSIQGEFEGAIKFGPVTRLFKSAVVPMGILKQTTEVDWLAGASVLMRVTMLHQIGLFDETFFLYYEETDLLRRAKQQGWAVKYVVESKVKHIGSASTGMKHWQRIPTYWLDSRRHYFIKNHGRLYFYLATVAKVLGHTLWQLRCVLSHKTNEEPVKLSRDLLFHGIKSNRLKSRV